MTTECAKCGVTGVSARVSYRAGILFDVVNACDACWATFMAGLEERRRYFGSLIDAGVDRAEANRRTTAHFGDGAT